MLTVVRFRWLKSGKLEWDWSGTLSSLKICQRVSLLSGLHFLVHHRFALQIKPKAWHYLQSGAITLCATMLAKVFFKNIVTNFLQMSRKFELLFINIFRSIKNGASVVVVIELQNLFLKLKVT